MAILHFRDCQQLRQRLVEGAQATPDEVADYHGVVLYLLFQRYEDDWYALIDLAESGAAGSKRVGWYERFAHDVDQFFSLLPGRAVDPAHLFALGFQGRRAFHYIFRQIERLRFTGATAQAARTHDVNHCVWAVVNRFFHPLLLLISLLRG